MMITQKLNRAQQKAQPRLTETSEKASMAIGYYTECIRLSGRVVNALILIRCTDVQIMCILHVCSKTTFC